MNKGERGRPAFGILDGPGLGIGSTREVKPNGMVASKREWLRRVCAPRPCWRTWESDRATLRPECLRLLDCSTPEVRADEVVLRDMAVGQADRSGR
jgi:hypothetical protein